MFRICSIWIKTRNETWFCSTWKTTWKAGVLHSSGASDSGHYHMGKSANSQPQAAQAHKSVQGFITYEVSVQNQILWMIGSDPAEEFWLQINRYEVLTVVVPSGLLEESEVNQPGPADVFQSGHSRNSSYASQHSKISGIRFSNSCSMQLSMWCLFIFLN